MSCREYEELARLRALKVHRELVRSLGVQAEAQGLSEEQLLAELEEDKQAVYKAVYGSNAA